MAEMLVLNPVGRRRRRKTSARKNPVRARARRRNPIAAVALARRRTRRRNPIAARRTRRARRRNPIALRKAYRRRRNPIGISGLSVKSIIKSFTDAAIAGGGAIAFDIGWNQVNRMLPATVQVVPGKIGIGDAIKAVATAALGALLNRPTKGLAGKAAAGALTIQARDMLVKAFPSIGMQTAGMGYYSPGAVIPMSARVGPNRMLNNNGAGAGRMQAYLPPGRTPLLNGGRMSGVGAYLPPGRTPLLNGRMTASTREGVRFR